MTNIKKLLDELGIKADGYYDNNFYVIPLKDSNDYAKMYTILDEAAINLEEPSFGKNTNNTTVDITNYFTIDIDNKTYNLFLIADFSKDIYRLNIKEEK